MHTKNMAHGNTKLNNPTGLTLNLAENQENDHIISRLVKW